MKKFTFMLLAAFIAVAAMADGPQKRLSTVQEAPFLKQIRLGQKASIKQAPKELAGKIQSSRARSPKKAVAAADLVGDYTWSYQTTNETSTDLENLEKSEGSSHLSIALSTTTDGGITISGMFPNNLEATLESDENGDHFVIEAGQVAGTSSYGDYVLNGMFFYEGDEQSAGGWYFSDIYGYIQEDGTISIHPWLARVLSGGQYDGYSLTPYWVEGSTLTPADPLSVVVAPEGLETEEYSVTARNYKDDSDVSGSVYIGFDGSDVYIQGLSTYLPDAWVKGTLDGTTITFPYGQYLGNYGGSYDMYLNTLLSADVVFNYDAEAGTLTAQNEFFLVDNSQYYFDSYRGAVFKKAAEKAVMPANPAIASLENGDYGWYLNFNVPTVDVNGDGLITSKLYYMIYTDVEGEIAPLTFTPATHERLTENMTEIPYGFTEDYDFYNGQIYLNDLYSEDWDKIGIQSIYTGGGEVNATEIQWFEIEKEEPVVDDNEFTFDFNAMNVATSSSSSTEGDILEALELTEGIVTLTISPKEEGKTTENRFWSTGNGPQLRVYSGTLTFSVPEGEAISQIVFNAAKWNDGNTADSGEFEGSTWTGEAQTVVVSIAANTQLNSIVVTLAGGEEEYELVVLPEGLETEVWTIEGTFEDSSSSDEIQRATEVAFDGTDVYVKGIPFWYEDAWMKGTLDTESGIVTFPTGQFVGEDEYGKEFVLGTDDGQTICDIQFAYDAVAKTLTQVTGYIVEGEEPNEIGTWGYWLDMVIYAGEPIVIDPVVAPEDLATETYLFKAMALEAGEDMELEEYSYQTEVGFYGNDVYFKGFSENTADLWAKGTLSEDGKTVTIPANQYMGELTVMWYTFKYFITAVNDEGEMTDIVLNYDADTNTFTTEQAIVLNGSKRRLNPYQTFTEVTITKMQEFAATPADPFIAEFAPNANYPRIDFNIRAIDLDGNDLLGSKLFYTIWVEKEGEAQTLTLTTGLYSKLTEDMTEIPYTFTDNYDIYTGGTRVYLNQDAEEIASWTKIGVQSIYYGGGECNKSNIVWHETGTGIASLQESEKTSVIYNIAGQRVQKAQKGLYIVNGKKVVVK